MKRSMCGIALLAAATALWSCNGDPTGSIRDEGDTILVDPTSVFLDQGTNKFVTVELVDGQGNQLEADFTPQNVGAGITVVRDTTFLETSTGHIQTSERFIVTGATPASTSFDLVSGGESITVPVRVLPISFAAVFSTAAPALNEVVTITAPSGFKFAPTATVIFGADTAVVTTRAADSSSISFVPVPGAAAIAATPTVTGVLSDVAPSAPLTIPTADALTIPAVAALPGTAAPGSAPAIPIPAAGQTTATFDAPDFAATIDHFYKLNVTEAGDYTITVDWTIGNDVDAPVCIADPTCGSEDFVDPTVSGNKPESGTFTLPVGTSVLWVEDFGAIQDQFGLPPGTPAIGARLKITISH
jgi:hypothetical protein